MARIVSIDRDTPILLPPDLRDWVPPDHLVHFIIDAMESINTTSAQINYRGTGHEQYPPAMLLALVAYSYCTGTFSSRQIEASSKPSPRFWKWPPGAESSMSAKWAEKTNSRTRDRNHQIRHGISALFDERSRESRIEMDVGLPSLQLQTPPHPRSHPEAA